MNPVGTDDPWWRFDWMPSPDEWSAIGAVVGGFGTFVAAVFALLALRVARGQLIAAVESNIEVSRPSIVVELVPDRMEMTDYRQSFLNRLTIVIENVGGSPARNIRFSTSPELDRDPMSPSLRYLLTGATAIPLLPQRRAIRHQLDQVRKNSRSFTAEQLDIDVVISVTYTNMSGSQEWSEAFPIHLKSLEHALVAPDPLKRISKDLLLISESLGKVAPAMKKAAEPPSSQRTRIRTRPKLRAKVRVR